MRLIVGLVACAWSLPGCSLTGYLVGSGIDGNSPDFDTLTTSRDLDPGDDVTIHKTDGTIATGTIAEPVHHLSFEQKLERMTGASSGGFDVNTGSVSNASQQFRESVPTSIVLRQPGNAEVTIPLESIRHIVVPRKNDAAVTGLIIGVAVDIAVVAVAVSAMPAPFRLKW